MKRETQTNHGEDDGDEGSKFPVDSEDVQHPHKPEEHVKNVEQPGNIADSVIGDEAHPECDPEQGHSEHIYPVPDTGEVLS